ncbi:TIGR04255 family protein [Burkholderia sp. Bp8990]|uniref:TIGR04255 family protein n=1 Tax=Burkholderia sp. Bp8990 TaxID=2184552 RepID=UPI000F59BF83|nr:TIGR04255 family protein [Burkholderia sp. Bp8990]RQS39142.1 TIGR04255 family protein [Burkholderia sp. Bp8990]
MHYTSNFLTKVVVRLDFGSNPISTLTPQSELSALIHGTFPHVLTRPTNTFQVTFGPAGAGINPQMAVVQLEHTKEPNGTTQAIVSPTHLSLEYGAGDYTSFPSFEADFDLLYRSFRRLYPDCRIDRIGLRYINEITGDGAALEWGDEIKDSLITGVMAGLVADARIARSMHQSVFIKGDDKATFHYGIWNQDFPAPIVRKSFVLDIDCYRESLDPGADLMAIFRSLNTLATDIFEASIEVGLRNRMGIEHE